MKKIIAVFVCIALIATGGMIFASCSKQDKEEKGSNPTSTGDTGGIAGGWTKADSPEITDTVKALVEKAQKNNDGTTVTPVAYIASQVVAGTNHLLLCKTAPVVPNAKETYALVTLYEDLKGGAEITEIRNSEVNAANEEGLAGGFTQTETPAVTDEAKIALNKACETLTGAEYTPVALLATQVVSGTNYLLLCETKATVPDAESAYSLVTVYSALDGSAEITETAGFEAEQTTQIGNPLVEYGTDTESLEEAEKAVGFEMEYPDSIKAENFIVISGTTLEIDFNGGYIRKAKGSDDISGDYNEYEKTEAKTIDGKTVTLKGNGNKVMLAIWTDGDYTYCVGSDCSSEADMISLVSAVK